MSSSYIEQLDRVLNASKFGLQTMKNIQISRNKGFDAYLSLSTTKMRKEDLEMDKIKISDAMVLTSAQIRTYKAAFHRSRDESANNDNNDVDGGDGVDARP